MRDRGLFNTRFSRAPFILTEIVFTKVSINLDAILCIESIRVVTKISIESLVQDVIESLNVVSPQGEVIRLCNCNEITVQCDNFFCLASWISSRVGRAQSCSSGHCEQSIVI